MSTRHFLVGDKSYETFDGAVGLCGRPSTSTLMLILDKLLIQDVKCDLKDVVEPIAKQYDLIWKPEDIGTGRMYVSGLKYSLSENPEADMARAEDAVNAITNRLLVLAKNARRAA